MGHDLVRALEACAIYMPSSIRAWETSEDTFVSKLGAKAALVLLLSSILDRGMWLLSMAYRRGLASRTIWRCHVVSDHCRGGMRVDAVDIRNVPKMQSSVTIRLVFQP